MAPESVRTGGRAPIGRALALFWQRPPLRLAELLGIENKKRKIDLLSDEPGAGLGGGGGLLVVEVKASFFTAPNI